MLKQIQTQKLGQRLSPQQIQLMKMLELPTIALEQRVKEEMEVNPALEEGIDTEEEKSPEEESEDYDDVPADEEHQTEDFSISDYMDDDEGASYKEKSNNKSPDEEKKEIPFSIGISFQDILEEQLAMKSLTPHQHQVSIYLIGNLDDDGYLRRDLESIVDDLAFSQNITTTIEELSYLLTVIQDFEPAGIGARNLQECLLLQLKRKEVQTMVVELATDVVENHMEEFSRKHYDKIARRLKLDEEMLKAVIHEILKLNPRPGNSTSDGLKSQQQILPDFTITNEDGMLMLSLNGRNYPDLRVSKDYLDMQKEYAKKKSKAEKEASSFVKQKLEGARWFIDALQQRAQTLLYTMNCIMEFQREYFLTGDETKLKPMILKDIAEQVSLDISTVSRVANSKYVTTPFGTFLIKTFFSESLINDEGEEVSTREVKKILIDCISAEDKKQPLTDDKLMEILIEKGYNIARRTIAKYREHLEIPVARLRKEL